MLLQLLLLALLPALHALNPEANPQAGAAAAAAARFAAGIHRGVDLQTELPSLHGLVRGKRILLVGHDQSSTGAPTVLSQFAEALARLGAAVEVLSLYGGPVAARLRQAVPLRLVSWQDNGSRALKEVLFGQQQQQGAVNGSSAAGAAAPVPAPLCRSPWVRPDAYDVIVASTCALDTRTWGHWMRTQVEAFGPAFSARTLWWVHEMPQFALYGEHCRGPVTLQLMARHVARAVVVSKAARHEWLGLLSRSLSPLHTSSPSAAAAAAAGAPKPTTPSSPEPAAGSALSLLVPFPPPSLEDTFVSLYSILDFELLDLSTTHAPGTSARAATRAAVRRRYNISAGAYVIAFAGQLNAHKGPLELLEAAELACRQALEAAAAAVGVACAHVVFLYGLRPQEAELRARVAALRALPAGHVHLEYWPRRSLVLDTLAGADALVMNSKCEVMGMVTVEAMALGLPVLGTACGGTLELVTHNVTGLLHANSSAIAELAAHINALNPSLGPGHKALADRLGAAARADFRSRLSPLPSLAAWEPVLQGMLRSSERQRQAEEAATAAGLPPWHAQPDGCALPPQAAAPPRLAPQCGAAAGLPSRMAGCDTAPWELLALRGGAGAGAGEALAAGAAGWDWVRQRDAPVARAGAASFQAGGRVYLWGGREAAPSQRLRRMWRYDLGSDQWADVAAPLPPNLGLAHLRMILHRDRLAYAVGGRTLASCASAGAYVFDAAAEQWHALPPLPVPLAGATSYVSPATNVLHVLMGSAPLLPAGAQNASSAPTLPPPGAAVVAAGGYSHLALQLREDGLAAADGARWVVLPPLPRAARLTFSPTLLPLSVYRDGKARPALRILPGAARPPRAAVAVPEAHLTTPAPALLQQPQLHGHARRAAPCAWHDAEDATETTSATATDAGDGGAARALHIDLFELDGVRLASGAVNTRENVVVASLPVNSNLNLNLGLLNADSCAVAVSNGSVLLMGGSPGPGWLGGFVHALHAHSESLGPVGVLPLGRVRGGVCAAWRGRVWFMLGQHADLRDSSPARIGSQVWSAQVPEGLLLP